MPEPVAGEDARRAPYLLRVREVAGVVDPDALLHLGPRRRQAELDQHLTHQAAHEAHQRRQADDAKDGEVHPVHD